MTSISISLFRVSLVTWLMSFSCKQNWGLILPRTALQSNIRTHHHHHLHPHLQVSRVKNLLLLKHIESNNQLIIGFDISKMDGFLREPSIFFNYQIFSIDPIGLICLRVVRCFSVTRRNSDSGYSNIIQIPGWEHLQSDSLWIRIEV